MKEYNVNFNSSNNRYFNGPHCHHLMVLSFIMKSFPLLKVTCIISPEHIHLGEVLNSDIEVSF